MRQQQQRRSHAGGSMMRKINRINFLISFGAVAASAVYRVVSSDCLRARITDDDDDR
jgi:hypothetical protein